MSVQVTVRDVLRSYLASVTLEEFADKATNERAEKIAKYLTGLEVDPELLDDTSDEDPNTMVQLLFDFMAFTEI